MRPAGFEPAAYGLGNRRSIHLSYGRPHSSTMILMESDRFCQRPRTAFFFPCLVAGHSWNVGGQGGRTDWRIPPLRAVVSDVDLML